MVTISSADKALKSLYLGVISNQLNTRTNAFLGKVEQTSANVWGKNIIRLVPYGLNGGVGAGNETGDLPAAAGNMYVTFTSTLKNLYGTIELTDKAIRTSSNNAGAFVNLLNSEMEGLLKASKFHFSRMLYGNGTGKLASTVANTGNSDRSVIKLDSVKNFVEGMIIDINGSAGALTTGHTVTYVDRSAGTVTISPATTSYSAGYTLSVQGSFNNEIYGLPYLFDSNITMFYGNARRNVSFALPTGYTANAVSNDSIQEVLDNIEENYGTAPNLIITSYDMRRKYLEYLRTNCLNIDHKEIEAGFTSITYNGIPLYVEKFAPENTAYFVNTDDFKLVQPSEWSWLENNEGNILHQISGKAAYYATLVKYCNLLCVRPMAQASLTYVAPAVDDDDSDEGND